MSDATLEIVVNGQSVQTRQTFLSYAQVVEIAGKRGIDLSVTWYRKGDRGGELTPGSVPVKVAAGMIFNVARTSSA